jgi:catechol 2,3-dioxygenase-like lactoylglutathione lyase family enzyme
MQDMTAIEVKAFVPSRDFALSKRFYQDLGFNLGWSSDELAYLHHGNSSFLLQNFYVKEHADNFMMHLLVENVEAWWGHVQGHGLAAKYGVKVDPPRIGHGASTTSWLSIRPGYCGASGKPSPTRSKRPPGDCGLVAGN